MKETAILVDKRVAGIIRWLERLKKSYSSGAMENALMDAECASADLENLRLDVWATLAPRGKPENKFLTRILTFSRVGALAAIIVLLTVFPISKEIQTPAVVYDKKSLTLAQPIIIIRENQDDKDKSEKNKTNINTARLADAQINVNTDAGSVKSKKRENHLQLTRSNNLKKPQPLPQNKATVAKPEASQKTVAYDKVFSLLQTGERALKNNSTVIKNTKN